MSMNTGLAEPEKHLVPSKRNRQKPNNPDKGNPYPFSTTQTQAITACLMPGESKFGQKRSERETYYFEVIPTQKIALNPVAQKMIMRNNQAHLEMLVSFIRIRKKLEKVANAEN